MCLGVLGPHALSCPAVPAPEIAAWLDGIEQARHPGPAPDEVGELWHLAGSPWVPARLRMRACALHAAADSMWGPGGPRWCECEQPACPVTQPPPHWTRPRAAHVARRPGRPRRSSRRARRPPPG